MSTPGEPAGTTDPGTTSTATRPTNWLLNYGVLITLIRLPKLDGRPRSVLEQISRGVRRQSAHERTTNYQAVVPAVDMRSAPLYDEHR